MMDIKQNYDLTALNTLGLRSQAQFFTQITTQAQLLEVVESDLFLQHPHHWLGGGSNVVMSPCIDAWVLQLGNQGIEVIDENHDVVLIKAQAGEGWHEFVLQCLSLGYSGLENLSLIPGKVGAAPVQNIGAYGVEVQDLIHAVECFDTYTKKWHTFSKVECQFSYRDSFFKHAENGRYVIWAVVFKLSKGFKPNVCYGDLEQVSKQLAHGEPLTAKIVSEAVCLIREQKLPDPKIMGNVGSFFHNPMVDAEFAVTLKQTYPQMPQYVQDDGRVKLAAGWLIEQAGLKAYQHQQAGVHAKQALVLVNLGQATYQEISELATHVQQVVVEKFGVMLHPEPNYW